MIKIKVEGLSRVEALLAGAKKQVKFATAVALTNTAGEIKDDLARSMRAELPGATPYTRKGQYVKPAKRDSLQAEVGVKSIKPSRGTSPALLVREHFSGGARGHKPMEKSLAAMKALPPGWHVVPGAGMKLDRYGNPNKTEVAEIIGALKRGVNVVGRRGKQAVVKGYFVALPGAARSAHLVPGVYRRINQRAISPMFVFVDGFSYRRRIDLPALANRRVRSSFQRNFDAALAKALATAR